MSTQNKKATAYQQLAQIVTDIKQEKISVKQAMNKLQIKDGPQRPYAKVSRSGAVALFGIAKDPIVLYESQWNRLQKTIESGYLRKYMEHNKDRISHGRVRKNDDNVSKVVEESVAVETVSE
jgi:hypothetical protein